MSKDIDETEIRIALGNAHWTKPEPNQYVIYVGRGHKPDCCHYDSNLGNPFTVEQFGRDKAIRLFDTYLEDEMLQDLVDLIKTKHKEGITEFILMCWCIPNDCHGSVIRKRLFELLNQDEQEYCLHSGGAYGADSLFGDYCTQYGIEQKHYYCGEKSQTNAPLGNTMVTDEDMLEGQKEAARAAKFLWDYQYETMKDFRLVRNWSQIKYCDAVFAIGYAGIKDEPVTTWNDNRKYVRDCVAGGTGYAVAMAILHNKPVYVYFQDFDVWAKYSYEEETYMQIDYIPKLTNNFAGIGSRNITDNGAKAIKQLFVNTFGE